ncbi:AAA family ATPase [Modestobacter sp. VKM Ac-2983]|uniref:UvrD-helicase domain-containing protein n=1 Tax=Modestobacter sp. VKM Ac-2983 TaxID=3004137 RepID=UPI0022AB5491|nr:UvrD-helicase domain-containing protein [Modestobacter sp. VKM Ac-2983]MCZ2804846.1 AAA family ATPase [Modestobacter sp. VKM Ac-2983]
MTFEFDASQQAIVEAGPEERLLVVAGAGRGKTEVIAGRVRELVDVHGLLPSDEVLVLTFSRAAVAAARRRLEDRGHGMIAVSTFDSFATQVLLEAGEDPSSVGGFDRRIRAATAALRNDPPPRVTTLRHVLLDEVQDLVGDRAELALAVLGQLEPDCGFTALGDPLQAVYDWQLDESVSKVSSGQLMARLVDGLSARRTALDVDYRARGTDPLAVVDLGEDVRRLGDGAAARERVTSFIDHLLDLGPVPGMTNLVDRAPQTTALLCRTNGQALTVSQSLREAGVRHVLRRPLEDVGVASWIGAAFGAAETPVLDRDEVTALVHAATSDIDPVDAWVALKEAERRTRDREHLDLGALRRALRAGSAPLGLAAADDASVVVSTIHRAKGLEFDRVLIVPAQERGDIDADPAAEMRVSYVALSRARDEVFLCQAPQEAAMVSRLPSGRWAVHAWMGRGKRRPVSMEAVSQDVDIIKPTAEQDGSGRAVQARLSRGDVTGAPLIAVLEVGSAPNMPRFTLHLAADGMLVGRTSEHFGRGLLSTFGRPFGGRDWPRAIHGMAIASVETVAGDPDLTRFAGLGGSGLWLVPRLTGLAGPDWKNEWEGWT